MPSVSLEQLANDIRHQPEASDLRLAYAAVLRTLGHPKFAGFIEDHIAYNQLAQDMPPEDQSLRAFREEVEKTYDSIRRQYFLPPNSKDSFALCVRNGLQRDFHLVAHQGLGEFWLDPFAEKELNVQVFRRSNMTAFDMWRCAFDLQPLCGLSVYRGFREVEILQRHGALKYASEIICNPKDSKHAGLIEEVAQASARVSALVLPALPEVLDTLHNLWSSTRCPLVSVKFHTGQIDMSQVAHEAWRKKLRILEFRDIEFTGDVARFFHHDAFPEVRVLGFARCQGMAGILKWAVQSGAFPNLAAVRIDQQDIEAISEMPEFRGIRVVWASKYPLNGSFDSYLGF